MVQDCLGTVNASLQNLKARVIDILHMGCGDFSAGKALFEALLSLHKGFINCKPPDFWD